MCPYLFAGCQNLAWFPYPDANKNNPGVPSLYWPSLNIGLYDSSDNNQKRLGALHCEK